VRVPVPEELLPAERLGRVHFIGIGGAGLSAIARIMLARGIPVSGTVPALVVDRDRLGAMSAAASGLIPRDADEKLARIVLAAARGREPS